MQWYDEFIVLLRKKKKDEFIVFSIPSFSSSIYSPFSGGTILSSKFGDDYDS